MTESYVDPTSGMTWEVRPGTDDQLALGAHESMFVSVCRSVLPQGGTFVDVGAHVGLYTIRLLPKAGKVYAFEANALTYEALTRHLELNDSEHKVMAEQVAVWDSTGDEVFLIDENGMRSGGSTRCEPVPGAQGKALDVGAATTATLDHLLRDAEHVDLIKIDVEGGERRVLDGATQVLAQHRPVLFIEMHDFMVGPQNRFEIERRLDVAGYRHSADFGYGQGYHWLCHPREDVE